MMKPRQDAPTETSTDVRVVCLLILCMIWLGVSFGAAAAAPTPPKEYTIWFDATGLQPPTFWQVPGVTQEMATYDPDSTDALRTDHKKQLQLKPGTYWYVSYTFSFQFMIAQDGNVDFAKTLDQCVSGRGTQTLTVTCRRMYPYGGQRDY